MLIRDGRVVTASGERAADVFVDGEKIVEVGTGIRGDGSVLDATDLLVLPGLVDPHTHLVLDTGTARTADDFSSGSASVAAGGVTTYLDFAPQLPSQTFAGALQAYGIHLNITHLPPTWERDLDT